VCAHHHFPCGNIAERWKIAVLPPYVPPLNLLDDGIWGNLQAESNTMAHLKMGSLKQTIWQLRAATGG
jgi:hypothetical protein